ncbi:MAG: trehalose-phosphatase [Ferrovibrio sp.]
MTDSYPAGQHTALLSPPLPQPNWALFLDVDGTLVDIAQSPDDVRVSPALRADLEAVASRLDGALALISGRSIEALDRLFHPLRLPASGQHGSEWRPAARDAVLPMAATPLTENLNRIVTQIDRLHPGILIERKSHAVAVHYRHAPELGPVIGSLLGEAVANVEGLMLMPGKCVWEIKDATQSKGTAVARFLQQRTFLNRVPVFIGDDRTDEDGFQVVEQHGGQAFAVGALARKRLYQPGFATPADVRQWLGEFAKGASA